MGSPFFSRLLLHSAYGVWLVWTYEQCQAAELQEGNGSVPTASSDWTKWRGDGRMVVDTKVDSRQSVTIEGESPD